MVGQADDGVSRRDLAFVRGSAVERVLPVIDEAGASVNLSPYTITVEFFEPSGGIVIPDFTVTAGEITLHLSTALTSNLERSASWCVSIATPDASLNVPIAMGRINILEH